MPGAALLARAGTYPTLSDCFAKEKETPDYDRPEHWCVPEHTHSALLVRMYRLLQAYATLRFRAQGKWRLKSAGSG
jgi:hypothetical protein